MPNTQQTGRDEVDTTLARLEEAIAQLDVKWRLFFMGSPDQRYPPDKETEELARSIRQFSVRYSLRVAQQFALSNLAHRFQSLRERWSKWLRLLETQGRIAVLTAMGASPPAALRRAVQASGIPAGTSPRPESAPPTSLPAEDSYERLYREFVQAYRQMGRDVRLDPDRFRQQVEAQVQVIRQKVGDRPLELYVTVERGRPKIKARVLSGD